MRGFRYLHHAYRFDTRSLSLFRIALGLLILLDMVIRLGDVRAFYTQEGVLPLHLIQSNTVFHWHLPVYEISDTYSTVILLLCIHAGLAVLFAAGYGGKWLQSLLLLFYISLHLRNPYITQGGDTLIRLLLFWTLFFPLHHHFLFKKKPKPVAAYSGFPVLAYLLQLSMLYVFSAVLKTSPEWHSKGTALYYAFNLDCIQWPTANYLLNYPVLLKYVTHIVFYFELYGPILLLVPIRNEKWRTIGVVCFVLFHAFIACTLFVGLFFLINSVALIPLLPASVIDKIKKLRQDANTVSVVVKSRLVVSIVSLLLVIYLLLWNIGTIPDVDYRWFFRAKPAAYALGIDQSWGMFAPGVFKEDGWFIYAGLTEKGDTIDLYRKGEPIGYEKPRSVLSEIKNDRWRKYNEHIISVHNMWMRPHLCRFIFYNWNQQCRPGQKIHQLLLIYMLELTPEPGEEGSVNRVVLWDYNPPQK